MYIPGRGTNAQYVANFVLLTSIYADYLNATYCNVVCGNVTFTPTDLLREAKRQVGARLHAACSVMHRPRCMVVIASCHGRAQHSIVLGIQRWDSAQHSMVPGHSMAFIITRDHLQAQEIPGPAPCSQSQCYSCVMHSCGMEKAAMHVFYIFISSHPM